MKGSSTPTGADFVDLLDLNRTLPHVRGDIATFGPATRGLSTRFLNPGVSLSKTLPNGDPRSWCWPLEAELSLALAFKYI